MPAAARQRWAWDGSLGPGRPGDGWPRPFTKRLKPRFLALGGGRPPGLEEIELISICAVASPGRFPAKRTPSPPLACGQTVRKLVRPHTCARGFHERAFGRTENSPSYSGLRAPQALAALPPRGGRAAPPDPPDTMARPPFHAPLAGLRRARDGGRRGAPLPVCAYPCPRRGRTRRNWENSR